LYLIDFRAAAFNDLRLKTPGQLCSSVINYNEALKIEPGSIK
jgi:hypothetical protein